MKKSRFIDLGYNNHKCKGKKRGEWIHFTCKHCDYERRYNLRTGEMVSVNPGSITALHSGGFSSLGIGVEFENPNKEKLN